MLKLQVSESNLEVGCDEAGRGCLAGPVVAAAVILPQQFDISDLNDSKKLSEKKRKLLRNKIEEEALHYAVAFVSPEEIDKINILNASFTAMHRAIDALPIKPEMIAVDGNRFNPYPDVLHQCIIKGDGKFANIAAASILAKTYRDAYMEKLDADFPQYQWKSNKGYPTKKHRQAIAEIGACIHHRKSFTLLPQLEIAFQ
ncbi:ribonuclease HII [Luteibaculum oceani]|uniref:Ribonuclease HII n=1 Tax=Luteibaculum oceani TaxID=1294296 RepID=A0A5C6UYI6_9FLAO|nr:ribonuclease HII [Luteibaculum oceani]TXC78357.1 ribonuclease HII [Luteibaculum oceani]